MPQSMTTITKVAFRAAAGVWLRYGLALGDSNHGIQGQGKRKDGVVGHHPASTPIVRSNALSDQHPAPQPLEFASVPVLPELPEEPPPLPPEPPL
jgi:hypothetical protein